MLLGLFKGPLMAVEVFDEHGECSYVIEKNISRTLKRFNPSPT
jgi:hypothetical protein